MSFINLKSSVLTTISQEHSLLFIYSFFLFLIAVILVILSYLFAEQKQDVQKASSFECGFDPFKDARHQFEIKFYVVAVLFLLFDLEILFLFPWVVTAQCIFSFYVLIFFLFLLIIGFIYEYALGALNWY